MTYPVREDTLLLKRNVEELPLSGSKVLEVGTGNGLVAVTAADKGAEVTATDIDPEALEAARERAEEAGVEDGIEFIRSDLLDQVPATRFDYILFNPPYLPGEKETEEDSTWRGGEKGIETTLEFLEEAGKYLEDGGEVLFIASSRADLEDLGERYELEVLDEEKLWFETLYLFKSD